MHLDFAQRHVHANAKDVRMHSHRALELVYYVRGKGSTRIDGTEHDFRRGVFAVIPASVDHDQIDQGPVTSLCFGLLDSGLEPFVGAFRDPNGELRQVCERILTELESRAPGWQEILQGLLHQVAGLVQRAAADRGRKPRTAELVDQALSIIRSHDGMLTVSELSEQLFVSHDYLRHLFQEHAGQSPMRHIIQARIDTASDLLAHTDLRVADVAERSGFESPYYFSRLFKQVTGTSPTAFRSQHAVE